MKEFKVGDRVIVTKCTFNRHAKELCGKLGTIRKITNGIPPIAIEFDEYIDGHTCNNDSKYGHGWFLYQNEIDLIQDSQPQQTVEIETDWRTDRYNFYKEKGWI